MTSLRHALLSLGALAVTACSSSDDTDGTDDTDTSSASSTIVDVAAGNPDFSTLVAALQRTGLDEALAGDGPFTVFAPTNDAFDALGIDLDAVPDDALADVLLDHVVSGAVDSGSIPAKADTLSENAYGNGLTLLFDTSSNVVINGGPTVTTADIEASNGLIHVVDGVILPMNVVDVAVAAGFTSLVGAVGAAADIPGVGPVADALAADEAALTVFAPTNDAFAAVQSIVDTLSAEQITTVLGYHVIAGDEPVLSTDLMDGEVTMLSGEDATVDVSGPSIEGAPIVVTDIHATNGVVHVVDAVMVPPSLVP